ncbi:MORN repeat protein [Aspergillus fischeri NRRL 181]|uniref:MORN repeat protein n=1 Tax=Neosartorya fischeri (strain ATCC 1020 / DSM 3700 / CBS 544.65 / FGSC A1164 / JCM 1740 / NRRL 181 / WB 181) TaxID=331117 RepID=A1DAK8_NEOFI|nr:MORN repeat protein [Aspergillus fischeri NRRL 181]EAW19898.1 MORN repeat protein [Aspergillus fischeri NRRL 181]KAG2009330.1 hypothetical protein GB937_007733 [Aspergillus fischeri]
MTVSWYTGHLVANGCTGNYEGYVDMPSQQPLGQGTMWLTNGKYYNGTWSDGRYHGTGTLKTAEFEYTGSFSKGYITGEGTMTYKGKGVYQGWFDKRRREGRGTMIWNNGIKYAGIWVDDKINGFGKVTWPNGDWFESNWNGAFSDIWVGKGQHGPGRAYWHWKGDGGDLYFGATMDRYRHGLGTLTTRDYKFEGNFRNGARHGTFKVTNLATKKITHHKYVNDVRV